MCDETFHNPATKYKKNVLRADTNSINKKKRGQCAWLKRLNNDFTITHGTQTDCFIKLLTKPSGEIDSTNLFTKEYVKWKIKSLKNNECNLKLIQRLENSFRQGRQQISKQNF